MIDINNVNLNLLKFLVIGANSKNLSEIAEKTGYSESNVSTNIKKLEKQMGVELFQRKPLKLTEMGEDIYEKVKDGFLDWDVAMSIAETKNNLEYGKISIGCPSHITDFFLIEQIEKATTDYPNMQIVLDTESGSTELVDLLKNNKIDFAIMDVVPDEYKDELVIKEIRKSENIFIAKEPIIIKDINELNNYKYILSYESRLSSISLKETLNNNNIKLKTRLICPTTEQRIHAAKLGMGLAYVMKEVAKKAIENKEVYEVKIPIELPTSSLKVVYLRNHLTKVDKEFLNKYIK